MSISMLNFETLLGFQCWSGGHSFNNTSFGVNIDISGTVVIEKKNFKTHSLFYGFVIISILTVHPLFYNLESPFHKNAFY